MSWFWRGLYRWWKSLSCPHNNVSGVYGEARLDTGSRWFCTDCRTYTNNPGPEADTDAV